MKEEHKNKTMYRCENCMYSEYEECKLMCDKREHEVMKDESCEEWRSEWEI